MRKIKLFLSMLMLIAFSVGNVWATDFTLSSAAEVTKDGITVTFAKGNGNNAPAWYSAGLRLYGSNTITIACDKDITEVTFNWEKQGSKAFASVTASVGDYTHPTQAGEGTWSGTSKSITFTLGSSGQLQLNTFSVTTASGGTPTCATPTFDPEDGEKFDESIDVEINAEDGATIYYTTDGNAPTTSSSVYSTALHFTETTTLKAMAVKAGSNNSAVATATYKKMVTVPGYAIDFESELDAYVDWEFSNIGIRTSTITAHGGTYYGSNVNGNGNATATAAIKTKAKVATPGVLTFYISKESNNTTASSWKAQVSADGSEWTDVETFDAKSMSKGAWNECTADLSEYSNVYVRINYSGSNAIRAIDDIELAEAAAVAKPTISGETPFLISTTVTLAQAGADHIYYTTNGNEPTTSSTEYTVPFELNATATVKAIAVKGSSESAVAEKTFTKATVLTVAEAIAAIPNKDDVVNNQYVAGIVCTEAPSLLSGGKLTYYISADGSETNKLQIYKGKNLNNSEFSSVSDLAIGDRVIVFGQLKNYNNSPEMNDGNYLVSKEGPAVAAPVFTPNGGGFMGETDVTITCATAGNAIYYTLDGSAPSKLSTLYEGAIHLNATTTITAIAYVDEEHSIVVAKTFTLTAPMTVAEALAALDSEDPINNVAVAGIISTAPTANPSSGKLTYFISDDGSASDELEVFLGFGLNGASFSNKTDLQVGDEVTVFGNLTIFNSTTKEFASGSRLLAFNRPEVAVTGIDLTESTAEVEVGKTVTLHASVVPANATNKTIVWSVQSGNDKAEVDANGVVTGIAAGEAVIRAASDENASIYKECTVTVTEPAPLSPWASVYTSNVTLSTEGGTSASAAKIKFYGEEGDGYDAIKAGTGSAQGAVVVNVPAGATALHFHAYSWYNETVELTVTAPTGVTVTPSEAIAINKNSGISGSSSTYTLAEGSDPKTDAYYAVSLSGNTEPVALTISATSGKRFVLFGVNQEGGVLPVLESIEIKGDLTTKTGYKAGDALDLEGLTVEATYSLGGVAQTPVDITNDPELALTYDPLVENQTEVTITATYKGQTDDITINDLVVTSADPKIYVSTLNVNFASVEVGESVPAAKTVTVNLTNIASVTATLGGTNPEAFSISKTEGVVDGDEITISILANTDAAASYSATLTISDGEEGADDKTINLSFAVTEPVVEDDVTGTWTLVTNATTLAAGKKVIIAQYVEADGAINTMAGQASNNRSVIASTVAGTTLTPAVGTKVMTLADAGEGNFYLKTSDGEYLYNASTSSKSYLRTKAEEENVSWTIAVDAEGVATITSVENTNRTKMRYNPNNSGSPLFNCYASGQEDIALYMLEEDAPEPTADYTRSGLTVGNYATICLPNGGTISGATLFDLDYYDGANTLYLLEVNGNAMVAGRPYVFLPSATTIEVFYTDNANEDAGSYRGLVGSYSVETVTANVGNYILYQNAYYLVNSQARVGANRAYIHMADVPTAPQQQQGAPRRRVAMSVHGEQVATGIDALNASDAPVKVLINGQLFIIRGEKMFDAKGQLVK